MFLCRHRSHSLVPLWLPQPCRKLFGRTLIGQANGPLHRFTAPCIAQCQLKLQNYQDDRHFTILEGLSRRVLVLSLIGILQLGHPVFAAEQNGGPAQDGEVRPQLPVPAVSAEDDRAVPRGVRPGKPLTVQSIEAPASNISRPVQENQISPEAAGKPGDGIATLESAIKPLEKGVPKDTVAPKQPKTGSTEDSEKEAKRLLDEEEERRKLRRRKKGRIRELEEIRAELAEKELVLLSKEQELLERDQTVNVLREELELEKKLRTLLTKEKEKAEEQSALALGLCTGGSIF